MTAAPDSPDQGSAHDSGRGPMHPTTRPLPILPAEAGRPTTIDICNADNELRSLKDIEEEAITLALTEFSGSISEAARRLGIGRSTLYRKMASMKKD